MTEKVWVFHADNGQLAGAVFSTVECAEAWIGKHALNGLLTSYPLDIGAFEFAVEQGHFTPKKEAHHTGAFIGAFSGGQEHHHYKDGKRQT